MSNKQVNSETPQGEPKPYRATVQDVESFVEAYKTLLDSTGDNLRLAGSLPMLGGPAGAYASALMNNLSSAFALSRALYQDLTSHAERMKEDGKAENSPS